MPRMGMGLQDVTVGGATVAAIDDEIFLNDKAGEVTPDFTGNRTNKILQSQTFKTTWTKSNATIPNDLYEAPDNSLTAQNIAADTAGASNVFVQQVVAVTLGETYTFSIHLKKGAQNFGRMRVVVGSTVHTIICNLTTGAMTNAGNVDSVNRHFDKMDDDWIRFGLTFQASATTSSANVRAYTLGSTASTTATSAAFQAGTDLMYLWGAQLEEDSRTSSYIVTTNAAVNVATTLNDLSEMFDFDGTDIMLETSLDKSEGAFDKFDNIVVNGNFAADSNWSKGSDVTIASGKLVFDEATSNTDQSLDTTNTTSYEITFTISDYSGSGSLKFQFAGASAVNGTSRTANGAYTEIITTTSNNSRIRFVATDFSGKVNNVIVSEYAITPKSV